MELKEIALEFENCETAKIKSEHIRTFVLQDIKKNISKDFHGNDMMCRECVGDFAIEISSEANVKNGTDFDVLYQARRMLFDRICYYNDIVSVTLYMKDDESDKISEYRYYVEWPDGDEYYNSAQKEYISKGGNLYIVISKDADISDHFSKSRINNPIYIDNFFPKSEEV